MTTDPASPLRAERPFDVEEADRLLTTTRSVRKRLDLTAPVDLDVITTCLEVAQQAPTGSNNRSYRFLVITDADKRAALADLYRKGLGEYARATAELNERGFESKVGVRDEAPGIDEAARTTALDAQTKRVFASARYLTAHLHEVPVHVIPCMVGRLPDAYDNFRAAAYYGSIHPTIWSFLLALRTRRYGGVFTTLHLVNEQAAAELLGIPSHICQIGLIPVARTTGGGFGRADRGPIDEVLYGNSWGEALR